MNTGKSSSKGGSKVGRKLNTLTNIKKRELCEYKIANPFKTNEEIGKDFGISKSVSASSNPIKRNRKSEWPELESALATWIDHANRSNYTITGAIICQKAVDYAERLNINEFSASQESIKLSFSKKNKCVYM